MRSCLVGLVDSGKSTALAALWFSVVENSERCRWYLENRYRPTSANVWTELRDSWLSGEKVSRTKHQAMPDILNIKLTERNSDNHLDIFVPDIAGEDFEQIFERGRFPKKHTDIISKSDVLIFFIRVDDYDYPLILPPLDGETTQELDHDSSDSWNATDMHSASKVIAIIKGLREICRSDFPELRIVLTAWDLVSPCSASPKSVFNERFPLVSQYLNTNFEISIMGVSAQGCDYTNDEAMKELDLDDITRIKVVTSEGEEHNDITMLFC